MPGRSDQLSQPGKMAAFRRRLLETMRSMGAQVDAAEIDRFVAQLDRDMRRRRIVRRFWRSESRKSSPNEIRHWVQQARETGDEDEAIWRVFLAAHFGGGLAKLNGQEQADSAALFLCAFGSSPHWTWARVSSTPEAFHLWLSVHRPRLMQLQFGNHRKFESQRPGRLWEVMESFFDHVKSHGGTPSSLFAVPTTGSPAERFRVLYNRLRGLRKFGRLGRFDFLVLLGDAGLVDAEPDSCYLKGATGPLEGARRLWGRRSIRDLDCLAAAFVRECRVSAAAVEDALCNWQKHANP